MSHLIARIRVDFAASCSVGPGKIALLEGIDRVGSLSQAARELGMSYRRAWLLLASLNASFREPVAVSVKGGSRGGGAHLTRLGRELVRLYRSFEHDTQARVVSTFRTIARKARRGGPATQPAPVRRLSRRT